MQLRNYQQTVVNKIYDAWKTNKNVCCTMPCGAGKTVVFSHIVQKANVPTCVIAHRKELVNQIALSLANYGVFHRIIGPKNLVKLAVSTQMDELGTTFYNASAQCAVAGVDTLIRREKELSSWMHQVQLWITDEAHHLVNKNKWHRGISLFPNAQGLGVTATPCRADGKGLGRHADGIMDMLVEGPNMRDLINMGWLTDYRIVCPSSDMDLSDVSTAKDGDYNKVKLKTASRRSHIVGDVVENYLKYAPNKLGITFVTDVETAADMAVRYKQAGVPAEVITATTPGRIRNTIVRRFRRREILQLVNVDIFGEGFDLPAIEVCSMARPTQSYGLFVQQFGRALRPMEGKDKALIIDHVGNVVERHGLPDKARVWNLDAREKRPRAINPDDDIPLRYCPECTAPYERILRACPYCGHIPVPVSRSQPEHVDGDLFELDPDVLARMRGEVLKVDDPTITINKMKHAHAPEIVIQSFRKNATTRNRIQQALRLSIDWWAAYQRQQGRSDSESYRLFFHTFGIDVLSARMLGKPDALKLANKVNAYIGAM